MEEKDPRPNTKLLLSVIIRHQPTQNLKLKKQYENLNLKTNFRGTPGIHAISFKIICRHRKSLETVPLSGFKYTRWNHLEKKTLLQNGPKMVILIME